MEHHDSWLFGLMTISNQPTENIDKAIDGRAMSGMLNLRNILQLVNNGLNNLDRFPC
jgi:hypothetical protein